MQLGWHTAAVVALGLVCGLLASAVTVWLLIRRGSPTRIAGVPLIPAGLLRRVFTSPEFQRDLRDALLASPPVQARLERALRDQIAGYAARPLGEVLTLKLQADIVRRAQEALAGPAAERMVRQAIGSGLQRAASSEIPLGRVVPWDLSPLIAAAVERAMPLVIAQLSAALRERENRIQLHVALRRMVDRFLAEQDGWKRTLGALLITDRALAHLVETISTTGVQALSTTLRDPETQRRIVEALDQSLRRALERPPRDLLSGLAPERISALCESLADRAVGAIQDPSAQERVAALLGVAFTRAETLTLDRVVGVDAAGQLSGRAIAALQARCPPAPSPGEVILRAVRPDLVRIAALAAFAAGVLALWASLLFTLL